MKATPIFRPVPQLPRRDAVAESRRATQERAKQHVLAATERVKRVIVAMGIDPHHVYGSNKHPQHRTATRGDLCRAEIRAQDASASNRLRPWPVVSLNHH